MSLTNVFIGSLKKQLPRSNSLNHIFNPPNMPDKVLKLLKTPAKPPSGRAMGQPQVGIRVGGGLGWAVLYKK